MAQNRTNIRTAFIKPNRYLYGIYIVFGVEFVYNGITKGQYF